MLRLCFMAAPVMLVIGCSDAPVDMISAQEGLHVPILRETRGAYSPIARPLRTAIYSAGQAALFPIELPEADFTSEMILVAAMGPAPDPVCTIQIHSVRRRGNRLRAEIEQRYPPARRRRRHGSASPYHAIVIPKTPLPIEGFSAELPFGAFDYERRIVR